MESKKSIGFALAAVLAFAAIAFAQMSMRSGSKSGDAPGLPDAQIAHIAVTADDIDIAYAHLALALSENAEIRRFAGTMISDHGAVTAKAAALAKKLGLTPEDNEVSQQLLQQAKTKMNELSALRGAAFDRAYAANELAYHSAVNAAVRDSLIPSARNAELKKLLQSAVPIFLAHEEHARRLTDTVNGTR